MFDLTRFYNFCILVFALPLLLVLVILSHTGGTGRQAPAEAPSSMPQSQHR